MMMAMNGIDAGRGKAVDKEGIRMMAAVVQVANESGVVEGPNAVAKAAEVLADQYDWSSELAHVDGDTFRPFPDGSSSSESIGDSMMRGGYFGIPAPADPLRRHPVDLPNPVERAERDPGADLQQRVSWWASLLGVGSWRLSVAHGADDRQLGNTSTARVHRTAWYDAAVLMFRDGNPSHGLFSVPTQAPPNDQRIVHELLHLVFDDWDRVETDALKMIPDDKVREVFADALITRQEQAIENLAWALTNLVERLGWKPDQCVPIPAGMVVVDQAILENMTFLDNGKEPAGGIDGPSDLPEQVRMGGNSDTE
jgi:hypothetical protein